LEILETKDGFYRGTGDGHGLSPIPTPHPPPKKKIYVFKKKKKNYRSWPYPKKFIYFGSFLSNFLDPSLLETIGG
jgi:hypothetical protein